MQQFHWLSRENDTISMGIPCIPGNGRESIINRKIKFIHSKSVEEDPTRIIRAARYAARLKFELTAESVHQIKTTLKLWPWEYSLKSNSKSIPPALSTRLQKELKI